MAATIVEAKWFHHLPIYRQQDLFAGSGWAPGRSTLLNIVRQVAFVIAPPARPYAKELGRAPGRLRIGFSVRSPLGTAVGGKLPDANPGQSHGQRQPRAGHHLLQPGWLV